MSNADYIRLYMATGHYTATDAPSDCDTPVYGGTMPHYRNITRFTVLYDRSVVDYFPFWGCSI